MSQQPQELDSLIEQGYVPSSIERKKTLLMYTFFGIIISLIQKNLTKYEMFHLKQAIGWWVVFFVLLIPSVIFLFFPYFWLLSSLLFIFMLVIWVLFAKQAWKGTYTSFDSTNILLPFFVGVGGWIIDIFEFQDEKKPETDGDVEKL